MVTSVRLVPFVVACVLGVIGNLWVLSTSSSLATNRLFHRQIWHLALASLLYTLINIVFEISKVAVWRNDVPTGIWLPFRSCWHFFQFMILLVEIHLAIAVYLAALRLSRVLQWLSKSVPFVWFLAAGLAVADYFDLRTALEVKDYELGQHLVVPILTVATPCLCFVFTASAYYVLRCGKHSKTPQVDRIRDTACRVMFFPIIFIIAMYPPVFFLLGWTDGMDVQLHKHGGLDGFWWIPICSNSWIVALVYNMLLVTQRDAEEEQRIIAARPWLPPVAHPRDDPRYQSMDPRYSNNSYMTAGSSRSRSGTALGRLSGGDPLLDPSEWNLGGMSNPARYDSRLDEDTLHAIETQMMGALTSPSA